MMDGKEYQLGRHRILLPTGHLLDSYQRDWRRYDVALGDVAHAVRQKYPGATAIDIGANVGDTAAILCAHEDMPVLAIEGNPVFLPYLAENAQRIGECIEVVECYVGPEDVAIDPSKITEAGGTASMVAAIGADGSADRARSLGAIVAEHPRYRQARLLKVDTDGFDFQIVLTSLGYLARTHPVVFIEYDTGIRQEDEAASLAAIEALFEIGYERFIVYDNFGNYLVSTDRMDTFVDLNAYLRSNRRHGLVVYYFDVCGFHADDQDIFAVVRARELAV